MLHKQSSTSTWLSAAYRVSENHF